LNSADIFKETNATKMLDLGCGTGFLINIAKKYIKHIDGVDVTKEMLDKVDVTGEANINLFQHDTGSFPVKKGDYDVVTAYSFLHHLYDITPTLQTAFEALKPGGIFYNDLDPNFYYWEQINNLEREGNYNPIVKREIEMVTYKDEDIEKNFGVSKDDFNHAEFGKNIVGGFKEEILREKLLAVGFSKVEIFYFWFLGQASIINNPDMHKEESLKYAKSMDHSLQSVLPLSRHLYKYLGFKATK
jgi:SAM-dependent methyltransferase